MGERTKFAALCAALVTLAVPTVASAAPPKPFGKLDCAANGSVRLCAGSATNRVPTWDGVPIDANVVLPATGDGPFPLVVTMHGYGGSKVGIDSDSGYGGPTPRALAERGFAVLAYTARGFGQSCGQKVDPDPVCAQRGWIRLADAAFEARDTQYLSGLLADEGLVKPDIGVTGTSYGGGQAMLLSQLRNRVLVSEGDTDRLIPWTSPKGTPMSVAAAAPIVPWTDLVYSLVPNGRTLDYAITGETDDYSPPGVMKQSWVSLLYNAGNATGRYTLPGQDRHADLTSYFARINQGEPYDDQAAKDLIAEIRDHHSPYYIGTQADPGKPAPTFIANGFTDDLFPVDEALRWVNRTRALYPDVPIQQLYMSFGHMRGQSKPEDAKLLGERITAWLEFYLRGAGSAPANDVTVRQQTCPDGAPSGETFTAADWPSIHPGEIRFGSADAQTVVSTGGDPTKQQLTDPITGGGACATTSSSKDPGTANYEQKIERDVTMVGAPTVLAKLNVASLDPTLSQITGRLWDVNPGGQQTLVARATYRPAAGDGQQVFQLHPNAYTFAAGNTVKLELVGRDQPYSRASNGAFQTTVSDLEVRLPTLQRAGPQVGAPASPVVPVGSKPAPGVSTRVRLRLANKYFARGGKRARRCARTAAVSTVRGPDVGQVARASFKFGKRKARPDRKAPFALRVTKKMLRKKGAGKAIRASVLMKDGRRATLRTKQRFCR